MLIKLENIYFNITGPDGVGKDSVLSNVLKHINHYKTFREPGGTEEAEIIRSIILCISDEERKNHFVQALNMDLLDLTREYVVKAYDIFNNFDDIQQVDDKIVGNMETYLYAASRNETNNRLVIPNLEKGLAVIGSRSVSCSMSYQGNARGLGYNLVWDINKPTLTRLPDFEIYLDISTEIAMQRLGNRKGKQDRLDNESFDFHRKTREGYLTYYDKYCPYPVFKVDASGTIEENTQKVLEILYKFSKSKI